MQLIYDDKVYEVPFLYSHRYGDVTPRSILGRTLGVTWMFIGVLLGSVITASITESITSTIDYEIKQGHKVCM